MAEKKSGFRKAPREAAQGDLTSAGALGFLDGAGIAAPAFPDPGTSGTVGTARDDASLLEILLDRLAGGGLKTPAGGPPEVELRRLLRLEGLLRETLRRGLSARAGLERRQGELLSGLAGEGGEENAPELVRAALELGLGKSAVQARRALAALDPQEWEEHLRRLQFHHRHLVAGEVVPPPAEGRSAGPEPSDEPEAEAGDLPPELNEALENLTRLVKKSEDQGWRVGSRRAARRGLDILRRLLEI